MAFWFGTNPPRGRHEAAPMTASIARGRAPASRQFVRNLVLRAVEKVPTPDRVRGRLCTLLAPSWRSPFRASLVVRARFRRARSQPCGSGTRPDSLPTDHALAHPIRGGPSVVRVSRVFLHAPSIVLATIPDRENQTAAIPVCTFFSIELVEYFIHLRGGEILVVVAIHHHHRRAAAGRETLFLSLQIHTAVGRAPAKLHAQLPLAVAHDVLGAVQPARDVGADR